MQACDNFHRQTCAREGTEALLPKHISSLSICIRLLLRGNGMDGVVVILHTNNIAQISVVECARTISYSTSINIATLVIPIYIFVNVFEWMCIYLRKPVF